ncbi:hypothetical protein FQR65_LT13358 [Abscondita terminalis]|nr:hypothetical protein FQR65_LT13358 [Abscondita terminalis]
MKRAVKTLLLHNKLELIKKVESGAKKTDVAVEYGIPRTSVSTILKNKKKKAGFGEYTEWDDEDNTLLVFWKENSNLADDDLNDLVQLQQKLRDLQNGTENVNVEDYLNVDENVYSSEFPTNEDFLEKYVSPTDSITHESGSQEEFPEIDDIRQPTKDAVLKAIETLNLYLQSNENTTDYVYNN